jgi:hypothetical protein
MKSSAHMPVKMSSDDRLEAIGALHREHARELERRVARWTGAGSQTIEDACAFAWLQLLTHEHVDLAPSCAGALAWLTQGLAAHKKRLGLPDRVLPEPLFPEHPEPTTQAGRSRRLRRPFSCRYTTSRDLTARIPAPPARGDSLS